MKRNPRSDEGDSNSRRSNPPLKMENVKNVTYRSESKTEGMVKILVKGEDCIRKIEDIA